MWQTSAKSIIDTDEQIKVLSTPPPTHVIKCLTCREMDDTQSLAAPSLIGCQALEQYLLLTKTARGTAAVELIQRVLEAPGVYVFGELLETECMKELSRGTNANYVQLLELFAYGTYKDYKRKRSGMWCTWREMCIWFPSFRAS